MGNNKQNTPVNGKARLFIVIFLILLGIGYNVYLIVKPVAPVEDKLAPTLSAKNLEELPEELKLKLKEQFNGLDKDFIQSVSSDSTFDRFLDSADIILNDSMNCDCPDVKRRMKEKALKQNGTK